MTSKVAGKTNSVYASCVTSEAPIDMKAYGLLKWAEPTCEALPRQPLKR